ncbi:TPA: hypothetical protein MW256_000195 [Acinetobacter baumannii]|nr:hypothetical protein [Acinetobacter baumannii]
MNALQYIKWYGIDDAKYIIKEKIYCHDHEFTMEALQDLVESVDIIKDLDGIKGAKGTLYNLVQLGWDEFEHRYIDNWMCTKPRLEQAIADYESIYGEGNE